MRSWKKVGILLALIGWPALLTLVLRGQALSFVPLIALLNGAIIGAIIALR